MNVLWMFYFFNEMIANISVRLSQASYCVQTEWLCPTCDPSVSLDYIVENKGSKAIQGFETKTQSIFTSFRGSTNIENWINNIQISKVSPYHYNSTLQVEKGFYNEYSYIKSILIDNLEILSQKYNTNKLLIVGHSLGAAMATLFSYDIAISFPQYTIIYLVTFGSPRLGNSLFVYDFSRQNIPTYRITHYYDIVPHLPEQVIGYIHVPNEIWYNEDNSDYKQCHDSEYMEDKLCSNSCAPIHCISTSDHLYYLNVSMGSTQC